MRLFEGTGVGTCVLTEFQKNLHEMFKPDEELVTYKCADEAIEKVDYLLKNKSEIYKISTAGQTRTLKDHTFDLRAEQLSLLISRYINK
jgi:spore maturation protein CgeB